MPKHILKKSTKHNSPYKTNLIKSQHHMVASLSIQPAFCDPKTQQQQATGAQHVK
jgi:hypothetical protein